MFEKEKQQELDLSARRFCWVTLSIAILIVLLIMTTQWEASVAGNVLHFFSVSCCVLTMFLAVQIAFVRWMAGMEKKKYVWEFVFFSAALGLLVGICSTENIEHLGPLSAAAALLIPISSNRFISEYRTLSEIVEGPKGK